MYARVIAIVLVVFCTASCDRAKQLAARASAAVKGKITGQAGGKENSKVDEQLQKLVDQTPEGTVFRKDLPFPKHLEVTTTRRHEMSGRFFQSSDMGKQANVLKGTLITVTKFKREDDLIRYTLEQADFVTPTTDKPGADKKPAPDKPGTEKKPAPNKPGADKKSAPDKPDAGKDPAPKPIGLPTPSARPVVFRKTGKSWGADQRNDFRAAALAQELAPAFDQLLIENALTSRPLWFTKRRFVIGDQLVVTGDTLPMLLAGDAKGSFTLKLESFAAVEGHPCGVFAVTGTYSRKSFPDFEGRFSDDEVTIQSGKIWFSLVYPIILKEELDTIQSFKSGGQGGLVSRGQGSVKVAVTRTWKSLDP